MRCRSPLLLAALAVALPAQAPRLVDSLAAPLAYLVLEAMPAPAPGAVAKDREAGPVQRLLADPSLDVLFGGGAPSETGPTANPSIANPSIANPLALARGLLTRSTGELEIALTSIAVDAGKPRLVLRARLQGDAVTRLREVLQAGNLAAPSRQLGGNQTYALRDARDADAVEIALLGSDLLVGNDAGALEELLQPARGTSAAPARTLATDARFQSLRRQASGGPGSLQVYADWQRIGSRLQSQVDGVPGELLRSSGLGEARAVLATVASAQSGFAANLLLDYDVVPAKTAPRLRPARPRQGPPPPRQGGERDLPPHRDEFGHHDELGIDGWFAAVRPQPARQLQAELPGGTVGGLVLALDLESVARRSHAGAHLLQDVENAFAMADLEFERCVGARLGGAGALRLYLKPSVGSTASSDGLRAVYTLRAKSRKAATDLFDDLRRVTERAGIGRLLGRDGKPAGRERKGSELLELQARRGHTTMCVTPVDDLVVLAADAETLAAAIDELRMGDRSRTRRDQALTSALQSIGSDRVAGLFDVDLTPLFERLAGAFGAAGANLDLSQLPKRHIGCLELLTQEGGTTIRCSVLSSR